MLTTFVLPGILSYFIVFYGKRRVHGSYWQIALVFAAFLATTAVMVFLGLRLSEGMEPAELEATVSRFAGRGFWSSVIGGTIGLELWSRRSE